MDWIFEYLDEQFYERHIDYLADQIDKHLEFIVDAVKFFGWKVYGKPYSLSVVLTLWLDDPKDENLQVDLHLEMGLSGSGRKKIEFRLINFKNREMGRFVFRDLPSWDAEDEAKLIEEWKKDLHTNGITGRKGRTGTKQA